MRSVKTTVWSHPSEFLQVYEWLFHCPSQGDVYLVQAAEQMRQWATRGNLPLSIESSLCFINVLLSDFERPREPPGQAETVMATHPESGIQTRQATGSDMDLQLELLLEPPFHSTSNNGQRKPQDEAESPCIEPQNQRPLSETCLRLMYSMALVRFVNGLVDNQQTKLFNQSVSKLAEDIGLPRTFVDLRHQATHEKLSSLSVLRSAALDAMDWLRDHYWEPQVMMIQSLQEDLAAFLNDKYVDTLKSISEQTPFSSDALLKSRPKALDKLVVEFFNEYESATYCAHLQRRVFHALAQSSQSLLTLNETSSSKAALMDATASLWFPLLLPMLERSWYLFVSNLLEWTEMYVLDHYGSGYTFDVAAGCCHSEQSLGDYFEAFESKRPLIPLLYLVAQKLLARFLAMDRPSYLPTASVARFLYQGLLESKLGPLHPRTLQLLKCVMEGSGEKEASKWLWLNEMTAWLHDPHHVLPVAHKRSDRKKQASSPLADNHDAVPTTHPPELNTTASPTVHTAPFQLTLTLSLRFT